MCLREGRPKSSARNEAEGKEGGGRQVSDTEWPTFSPVRWNPEGDYVKEIESRKLHFLLLTSEDIPDKINFISLTGVYRSTPLKLTKFLALYRHMYVTRNIFPTVTA